MQTTHNYVASVNNNHTKILIEKFIKTFKCEVIGDSDSKFVILDLGTNQVIYTGIETIHDFSMNSVAGSVAASYQSFRQLDFSVRQRVNSLLSDYVTPSIEEFLYQLNGALTNGIPVGNIKLGEFPTNDDEKENLIDCMLDNGFTFTHDAQTYYYYIVIHDTKTIIPIRLCENHSALKAHILAKQANVLMTKAKHIMDDPDTSCDIDFDAELSLFNKAMGGN